MVDVGGHVVCDKQEAPGIIAQQLKILKEKPFDPAALSNLCNAYNVLEEDEKAMEVAKLGLFTPHPVTWFNYALLLKQCGRYEEAFPFVERAHLAWPDDAFMGHVYAEELIRQGKWLEAWPLCSKYRYTKSWIGPKNLTEWKGEDIRGKRLAVITEGGHGDAFWLLRFFPKLREIGAIPVLHTIQAIGDYLSGHPYLQNPENVAFGKDIPYDYWVSIFELLQWLEVDKPYWPGVYLWADPQKSELIRPLIRTGVKKKVGLVWQAAERLDVRRHRSLSEDQAARLLSNDSVDWVSLQYGMKAPAECLEPPIHSWSDSAAIVDNLDLIVTMDTAMVHLAGAMGKPTWLVIGGPRDCKWGKTDEERSGWYPSVRIFQNEGFGFGNVLTKLEKALDLFSKTGVHI
jgi:tetratricopeptide (TPR) repeat protein